MILDQNKRLEPYLKEKRLLKLYESTRTRFEESGLVAHNWDHTYRDVINAIWIGEAEGADMEIVLPSMILHDIGFLHNPDFKIHHRVGAEHCGEWLTDWEPGQVEKITRCILTHKGSTLGFDQKPNTIEEKVVCDADSLEKTGHMGILQGARVFVEFAANGMDKYKLLSDMAEYFSMIPPMTFFTETGKRIAESRGGDFRGRFSKKALDELAAYRD
ncbi:HD domain-containing protein [Thermodesulfobacteriota bacterium]